MATQTKKQKLLELLRQEYEKTEIREELFEEVSSPSSKIPLEYRS